MINAETLAGYYEKKGRLQQNFLTKQFQADLPQFSTHEEAAGWFKALFGDDFIFVEKMKAANEAEFYYLYDIIHDRERWERRERDIREKGFANGLGMLLCAQRVDIYEDGSVELAF
ncbi:hypothetical protein [Paenibacillus sabinae]|uniref:Uncharacterized protein n=1 Tax=Paenibacillus sabinae T27 TaxID=1268072 RepID=X4ZHX0_9BACL|nr:hypothetical protein [Paenibacillus sabinae]AHV99111.1 hypothetical protein PSAB_21100 [Paenibacillus sabinae T27]